MPANSALLITPDHIYALNNKGMALRSLGDWQEKLTDDRDTALRIFTNYYL